jgi:hypothetical protein
MKYELAKKLKDLGFPQHEKEIGASYMFSNDNVDEKSYIPTLSELIDACGNRFGGLKKIPMHGFMASGLVYGFDTPEDAVANLWIMLNEVD